MTGKITVVYFDIGGAAEPIRWALEMGEMDWEDKRISREEFAAMKPTLPNGQVPIIEFDDKVLAQSGAIMRFVGKKCGLYPTDDYEAAKCDAAIECTGDLQMNLRPSLIEPDEAKKMEIRKSLATEFLPKWYGNMEKHLQAAGGKYFANGRLTIADLAIAVRVKWLSSGILDGIPADLIDSYPLLKGHLETVLSEPKIKAFVEKHQK